MNKKLLLVPILALSLGSELFALDIGEPAKAVETEIYKRSRRVGGDKRTWGSKRTGKSIGETTKVVRTERYKRLHRVGTGRVSRGSGKKQLLLNEKPRRTEITLNAEKKAKNINYMTEKVHKATTRIKRAECMGCDKASSGSNRKEPELKTDKTVNKKQLQWHMEQALPWKPSLQSSDLKGISKRK